MIRIYAEFVVSHLNDYLLLTVVCADYLLDRFQLIIITTLYSFSIVFVSNSKHNCHTHHTLVPVTFVERMSDHLIQLQDYSHIYHQFHYNAMPCLCWTIYQPACTNSNTLIPTLAHIQCYSSPSDRASP